MILASAAGERLGCHFLPGQRAASSVSRIGGGLASIVVARLAAGTGCCSEFEVEIAETVVVLAVWMAERYRECLLKLLCRSLP